MWSSVLVAPGASGRDVVSNPDSGNATGVDSELRRYLAVTELALRHPAHHFGPVGDRYFRCALPRHDALYYDFVVFATPHAHLLFRLESLPTL
jgi:hypothetical protein